jgi:hypothetical protein
MAPAGCVKKKLFWPKQAFFPTSSKLIQRQYKLGLGALRIVCFAATVAPRADQ